MTRGIRGIIQEMRERRLERKMEHLLNQLNREVMRQRTMHARSFLAWANRQGLT